MSSVISVDVLVIGGGPQGLWVLEKAREAGLSCVLVEKNKICSGQAAHAEWFLHRGAIYSAIRPPGATGGGEADYVPYLNESAGQWQKLISGPLNCDTAIQEQRTLYGFRAGWNEPWEKWCQLRNINVRREAYSLPGIPRVYSTDEVCVNPTPVLNRWVERRTEGILQIHELIPSVTQQGVSSVQLRFHDDSTETIKPSAVVVCTGAASLQLLKSHFGVQDDEMEEYSREGFVLAIRGSSAALKPVNYCLIDSGHLLVVSRAEENGDTTVFVSTGKSWSRVNRKHDDVSRSEWIKGLWRQLTETMPFLASPNQFRYQLLTGELRYAVKNRTVQRPSMAGSLANVILASTPRLTLAPAWADLVVAELRKLVASPVSQPSLPAKNREAAVAPQYSTAGFTEWEELRTQYGL